MLAAIIGVLLNFPTVVHAAVTLAYFTAEPGIDRILIKWGTASEFDILGFYVLRSNAENGFYLRIHDDLIASTGGSIVGADYTLEDTTPIVGETYFYKLEVVDFNNQSEYYGPIFTTYGFGTLTPTVTRTCNTTNTFTPTRTTTWTLTPSRTATLIQTSTATRTKTTTRTRTPTQTKITSTLHTKTATRTVTKTRTLSNVIYRSSTWTKTASPSASNTSTITMSLEPSATSGTPTKTATSTKIPPLRLTPTPIYYNKQSDSLLKMAITLSIILFLTAFLYIILVLIKKRRRKSENAS